MGLGPRIRRDSSVLALTLEWGYTTKCCPVNVLTSSTMYVLPFRYSGTAPVPEQLFESLFPSNLSPECLAYLQRKLILGKIKDYHEDVHVGNRNDILTSGLDLEGMTTLAVGASNFQDYGQLGRVPQQWPQWP